MRRRRAMTGLLAVCMILSLLIPAAAAGEQKTIPLKYADIEKTVRENNLTLKILRRNLDEIDLASVTRDIDDQIGLYEAQKAAYDAQAEAYGRLIAELQAAMAADPDRQDLLSAELAVAVTNRNTSQAMSKALPGVIDSLKAARTEAKDGRSYNYDVAEKGKENAALGLILAAQQTYLGIGEIQNSIKDMERVLTAADRNILAGETMVRLGRMSTLTLTNLKQARNTAQAQKAQLESQKETAELHLSLLCGLSGARYVPDGQPEVPTEEIDKIAAGTDIPVAQQSSYLLWQKREAVKWEEQYGKRTTVATAKAELTEAEARVEQNVLSAAHKVREKRQALTQAAQEAAAEEVNRKAAKIQYDLGRISRNAYLDKEDEQKFKANALVTARLELMQVYEAYRMLILGYSET